MDILTFPFFQRALIGGIFIGIMTPFIGMFVVLRRLSLIGDTLAHVSIAGVALGFLINIYPLVVGAIFSLIASFIIERLRNTYKSYAELSLAIMMSGGIALASVLFTLGKGFNMNVQSFLFGSILTLSDTDIWVVFGVMLLVLAVVMIYYKELFLITFDEDAASVNGLPLRFLNMLMTVLTSLVISVSIKVVGGLLISALLTIPVACSLIFSRSFRSTMLLAVVISEIAVISGLIIAGVWNLAPGGTVVLLLIAFLSLSLLGKRGLKI